jgi:hypothetical protein
MAPKKSKRSHTSTPQRAPPAHKAFASQAEKEEFSLNIAKAGENWEAIVRVLCEHFQLPPLNTRKGLKQLHADFDTLYGRLDAAYKMYEKEGKEMVMGGIVGIFAKMCTDSLLRNKLFDKSAHVSFPCVVGWHANRSLRRAFESCAPPRQRSVPGELLSALAIYVY